MEKCVGALGLFLIAAITGLSSAASAADWKPITAAQSPLYFAIDIPQVIEDGGWDADYSQRTYRITSIPKSGLDAQAALYLVRLAPNYFFQTIRDARGALKLFKFFNNAPTILQDQRTEVTGTFRTSYLVAKTRGRTCIVFSGKSGQGGGDAQYSEGTSILTGYYCQPVSDALGDDSISTVLNAIGTKAEGTAARASTPPPFKQ